MSAAVFRQDVITRIPGFMITLVLVFALAVFSGCGNKGALYLDKQQEPVAEVAAPDALEDDAPMEFPRDGEDG